ncbi:reverse transcriptase domain-containing protein [Tanacetum coccineum]
MPKFNKWLSTLLRNKEKLEEIAITIVNAECSAIILNKVPEKLKDPRKFLILCVLQELDRTNALSNSGASINLLPHSIYKQLGLGALKPTRMTLELANHSVTHPMGIAKDVVVIVDGFTFLADFVVVNFEPEPRVPIILGRPFLRTAKALIDLYEEKLTLRVGNEPFSGSTTIHSDALPPSSSPVKTSDNLEEFADELTLLKKGVQEENFQVYSNPLFEFDDNFNSSNINPLFNEKDEDDENENSNVSNFDEPVLLNTPLSDKVECSDPEVDINEIDAFLAMEVSSNFEEGYYDSEEDVIFLENLLSDDTTHNLVPEVIFDHEPKQNESIHDASITFSPRNDPLHHEFAGEIITLHSRIAREHEEYLSLMTLLCEISTSQSPKIFPASTIPVEDSDPVQEEIDIFLVPDDLIPPGVENDDSKDEDNSTFLPEHESPNLDHQDNPSAPRPPPEPPDVKIRLEPDTAVINNFDVLNKDACFNLEEGKEPESSSAPKREHQVNGLRPTDNVLYPPSQTTLLASLLRQRNQYTLRMTLKNPHIRSSKQESITINLKMKSIHIPDWFQKPTRLPSPDRKLSNLKIEERLAFSVALRMFTRSIVIQRRVEDFQLAYSSPRGFIYQNKDKKNNLILRPLDKLYKFSDGTLNDFWTALDDRLKGIRMEYLPKTIWRQSDRERATAMI